MDLRGIDRKKLLIHLIILVVFVIYLASAGFLFDTIIPVKDESRMASVPLPDESRNVTFIIDSVKVQDLEWKVVISIKGWAFQPDQNASTTRKFVALLSENSTYVFGASPVPRHDVLVALGTNNSDYLESGFYANIPVYNIGDGQYQVGLILMNETGSSFTLTDTVFTKTGERIVPYRFSEMTGVPRKMITSDFPYFFDEVREKSTGDADVVSVSGWAFIPGGRSAGTKAYIVLASDTATYMFSSVIVPRPDVGDNFRDPAYSLSGFHADIPVDSLVNGTYKLGIVLRSGDMTYHHDTNTTVRIPGGEWSGVPVPS